MSSLGKRKKREKASSDDIALDENNKTSTKAPWSLWKTSIWSCFVQHGDSTINYEEQIEAPNKLDVDSTFLSFPILGIPDLPSIYILDNDVFGMNSKNIVSQTINTNGCTTLYNKNQMVETVQISRGLSSASLLSTRDSIKNEDWTATLIDYIEDCKIRTYCPCTPGKVTCTCCFADHVCLLET